MTLQSREILSKNAERRRAWPVDMEKKEVECELYKLEADADIVRSD